MNGTVSNINFEEFDDEINGINLSKLFSVYGPNSVEHKKYQRKSIMQEKGPSYNAKSGRST